MTLSNKIQGIGVEGARLFGLYLPVFHRFLLVYYEPAVMHMLKQVLSSKIDCLVVELSDCKNYHHTIIDNDVCLDWSLEPIPLIQSRKVDPKSSTLINRLNTYQPLIQLQALALDALAAVIILDTIKGMDQDKLLRAVTYGSDLVLESRETISFHHDSMANSLAIDLEKHLTNLGAMRTEVLQRYLEGLYWAQDSDEILSLFSKDADDTISMHINELFQTRFGPVDLGKS